jgi:hypothetical protein
MDHRWGHRLSTNIPVRLSCLPALASGCRCLGCLENVSASGASIRTELGICPAPAIVVRTLPAALGLKERELEARVVRATDGEIAIEWTDFSSAAVCAVLKEAMLMSGASEEPRPPALGRVPFCALAPRQ